MIFIQHDPKKVSTTNNRQSPPTLVFFVLIPRFPKLSRKNTVSTYLLMYVVDKSMSRTSRGIYGANAFCYWTLNVGLYFKVVKENCFSFHLIVEIIYVSRWSFVLTAVLFRTYVIHSSDDLLNKTVFYLEYLSIGTL